MKRAGTSFRLTMAVLGTVALFGAAAAAGIDRNAEMMNVGIAAESVQTGAARTEGFDTGETGPATGQFRL